MALFIARNDSTYGKLGSLVVQTDSADRCMALANSVEQADWYIWALDGHTHREGILLTLPRGHKLPERTQR